MLLIEAASNTKTRSTSLHLTTPIRQKTESW